MQACRLATAHKHKVYKTDNGSDPILEGFFILFFLSYITRWIWERSGSVVECLTGDRGTAGSSLTGVTALCP